MPHHSYITSLAQLSNCYNTVDETECKSSSSSNFINFSIKHLWNL